MPCVGLAQRHGALGERSIGDVLRGSAEADPLVSEAAADPVLDHGLQNIPAGFEAHPVQQFAASPHLLERKQIAAFVVDAGQAITNELFGDVCQPVAVALLLLFCREGLALAYVVEYVTRAIGDSSVKFAVFVVVVSSAHAVGSVLG